MTQYKPLDKGKYADKVADYFYQNEANNYAPQYQKEALRKLKQWALKDGNLAEIQRAYEMIVNQNGLGYNGNVSNSMVEHAHKKMHGKLKKFYKSIVASSLAIPLLFNIANASDCNLECNVKKDTAHETSVEANTYNPLKIPLSKKSNFKDRYTAIEETPEGTGIFVYDSYSVNDSKKEKIDYVIKSRVVFELPEPANEKNESNSKVYLIPFQYMWIDKEGNSKVAIDLDGKINGNEIDITEQYKELMKQFLEQQNIANRKIDV